MAAELIDVFQTAPTGRARCRACGVAIEKGAVRFGEASESTYGEGEGASFFWFHPRCAAFRRPEKFAVLARVTDDGTLPDRATLLEDAERGLAHERLPRIAGVEMAPSGRARCRHCKELVAQGEWRIRLSAFAASGFFEPLGFVHAACALAYFGVSSIRAQIEQSAPSLDPAALALVIAATESGTPL